MRVTFHAFYICCLVLALAGCADILPWPGFESPPGIFSYPEQIPATEVAEQVRCELASYIQHDGMDPDTGKPIVDPYTRKPTGRLLDPDKGAQVQLKLTTDLQGYVQWLGINLNGLGLSEVAALVTKTNNNPSLQLKAQGKSTTVSQIDFVIPQTLGEDIKNLQSTKPPRILLPKNLQLPNAPCRPNPNNLPQVAKYLWFDMWLEDALGRYAKRIYKADNLVVGAGNPYNAKFYNLVCQPNLTISTQFQLLFDVSAGTNVFNAFPIILPISGLNIDGSPDYTHYLQIAFTLKQPDDPETSAACKALQPQNAPAAVH
jgi:hypothetical protein